MQGALEFIAAFLSGNGEKRIAIDCVCVWVLLCMASVAIAQYSILASLATPFIGWLVARAWARKALSK